MSWDWFDLFCSLFLNLHFVSFPLIALTSYSLLGDNVTVLHYLVYKILEDKTLLTIHDVWSPMLSGCTRSADGGKSFKMNRNFGTESYVCVHPP